MPTPLPKPTAPPSGISPVNASASPSLAAPVLATPVPPPNQNAPSQAPVSQVKTDSPAVVLPPTGGVPAGATPTSQPGGALRMAPPILAPTTAKPATPVSPIAVAPQPAHPVVMASPVRTDVTEIKPAKPGEIPIPPPSELPAVDPSKVGVVTPVVGKPLPVAPQPTPAQTASVQSAQTPPQTVTALASVSSNQLPAGAGKSAPPPKPAQPKPAEVEFAKPKRSILTFIPIIIGVLLIAFVGIFIYLFLNKGSSTTSTPSAPSARTGATDDSRSGGSNSAGNTGTTTTGGQPIVLQYWGLWEPADAMKQIIDDYKKVNPNVSVQYTKQSHLDYRTRLQTAVASGNGPDLFRYHATWVPMLKTELATLPSAVMSATDFQQTFYPVASKQLQNNGSPVGIPLMYEGLALFYNVEAFNTAVVQPPTTWGELRETAKKLTIMEGATIKRAGIALGYTSNIDHFSDVVALLSLQNGADLAKPSGKQTIDALTFYTLFAKDRVWDETLPSSTVAFARGDVAMIFAPSWRAHDIKQMNPNLQFATVPVPQLDPAAKVSWANYWAEGVSSKSKYQKEAWEFLKYLSSKESQQKIYNAQSQTRSFGELYSRVDLASQLVADKVVGSFISDAPKATGWYMSSFTHDKGINEEVIKYYEDAINSMNEGKTASDVIDTLSAGVAQVLQKYQVSGATSTGGSAPAGTSTGPSGSSVAPAGSI